MYECIFPKCIYVYMNMTGRDKKISYSRLVHLDHIMYMKIVINPSYALCVLYLYIGCKADSFCLWLPDLGLCFSWKSIWSLNVRQLVMYYSFYLPTKKKGRRKEEWSNKIGFKPFFQDPIDFHPVSVYIILNIFKIK